MTAWSELITNSTAPNGSTAWTHLISQEGGGEGGDIVYVPCLESDFAIDVNMEANTLDIIDSEISLDIIVNEIDTLTNEVTADIQDDALLLNNETPNVDT
jgi:hypothetical protein